MTDFAESVKAEIDELVNQGLEVKQKIEDYLDGAISIDEAYKAKHQDQNYISLDDLPYAEEIIRTEGLPASIEEVIQKLEDINLENTSVTAVSEAIDDARKVIIEAEETVDDCTDLPPQAPEHDDDSSEDEDEDEAYVN